MLLWRAMCSQRFLWYLSVLTTLMFCSLDTAASRSQMSCGSRSGARAFVHPPCDLSKRSFCVEPGNTYPWKAVRRYIYENQGLMRRMYGDQRQGELLIQEVAQERSRFDSSIRSGRLLQIMNEHEIQDLQNLEELRILAQRAGRFGDHENLIHGQHGTPEPRRSVRFNSRYSSFDDPPAVPVAEEDVDIELLPSPSASPYQGDLQRNNLVESGADGDTKPTPETVVTSTAVEDDRSNSKSSVGTEIEKGPATSQVETTSISAEITQTGPAPTTQQSATVVSEAEEVMTPSSAPTTIDVILETSSGGTVSVMASGKPQATDEQSGHSSDIDQAPVTGNAADGATTSTTTQTSSTAELPENLGEINAALYSSRTNTERPRDDEMVFSSIDAPFDSNQLGQPDQVIQDHSTFLPTDATSQSSTAETSSLPKTDPSDSGWTRTNEETPPVKSSVVFESKTRTASSTQRPRRRPPPTLEEPTPIPDQDQPPVAQIKGIAACPTKEEVVSPYWANNTRGEVLALLNVHPFEQYIHSETCAFDKEQMLCRRGCRCEQQFRLHRLLAFDPRDDCRGVFSDWFRFPAGCVCVCYDLLGLSGLFKL